MIVTLSPHSNLNIANKLLIGLNEKIVDSKRGN